MAPDERAWNRALRSWFFRPDLAGRPAYLAVDEETLADIGHECHLDVRDATESLSQVVRSRVSSSAPLGWWVTEAARWKRAGSESDPPFLTVLAVTVLAATIVDDVNDRKYYRRLNGLLGLPGTTMPRYFDSDVQQLWTHLNEWLTGTCHDRLGMATATNVGGLANVGWAQSQTLLRPSDRAKLPLFFTALGALPGQLVDGDLLVRRLRSWSSGGHAFSRRVIAVLQDPRLSELLADALHSELAHWDGTLRDEAGRMALKLLLAFHERSGKLQAAVQVPEQLGGTTLRSGSLASPVELAPAGELQLLDISVSSQILDGLALRAELESSAGRGWNVGSDPPGLTLVMPRRDLHLLCPDDRLARWVEVRGALLHRPHMVLLRSELSAAATDVMTRLGGDVQPIRRIHCPAGWDSYRFTPSCFELIEGPLSILSPGANDLSALAGGLPISKRRRIYLSAGPPDLVLDLRESSGLVTVDNSEASPDSAGRLRLADLRLSPGMHSVSVSGVHYQLTLVDEFADHPRNSTLSFAFDVWRKDGRIVGTVPADETAATIDHGVSDVTVRGAAICTSPLARAFMPLPHPSRSRNGGRHYVLGRPGQAVAVQTHPPQWLLSLRERLAPHLIDPEPVFRQVPFTPVWLMRVSQGGVTVSALHGGLKSQSDESAHEKSGDLWSRILTYIADAVPDMDEAAAWYAWKQTALASTARPELDQS